jgi:hypothetical protein
MTYDPEFLKRWTMPPNYFGAVWPAYFSSGVGQSRESSALESSNFECMLRDLGGETETRHRRARIALGCRLGRMDCDPPG